MPRSPSDPELKSEFSARIKQVLNTHTAKQVAEILGVRTQTVYNYRDGKNSPSHEVIRRAMEAWPGFVLSYRGKSFSLNDFQTGRGKLGKLAYQLELWNAIKNLDSRAVEIEILKKESTSVQLGLRIRFPEK